MNTTYNIRHVSQIEKYDSYEIQFTIDDFPFSVVVYKPIRDFQKNHVSGVFHEDYGACPICTRLGFQSRCYILNSQLDVLFEQLISSNSLRLLWLYREYKVASSP